MKFDTKNVTTITFFIIGAIILFTFLGTLVPEYSDITEDINNQKNCEWNGTEYINCRDVPLSDMFSSDGLVFLIIIAVILIGIVKTVISKK